MEIMSAILGMERGNGKKGLHHHLRCREYGRASIFSVETLPDRYRRKLNSEYHNVIRYIGDLKSAVSSASWTNIGNVITDLAKILIESFSGNDNSISNKRQLRHVFVIFGGLDALLKIFSSPISPSDARNLTKATIRDQSEIWNEILVMLRELLVTIPSLPDRYISLDHIKFIFTLLHHSSVFEAAVSAIEEILACRDDPFPLYIVPNFFGLVKGFSSRHLAHFCRILSLTIFEPEDRHILEGTQVLRSMDLLRIRRTRMFKSSNYVVEKNQNMLIQMPEFFPRLIQILRVINHGPELFEFTRRNIIAQLPISTDVLIFPSALSGVDDWEHFRRLEKAVEMSAMKQTAASSSTSSTSATSSAASSSPFNTGATSVIATELLDALTPSAPSGALEIINLVRVMLLAERLGVAEISPLGQAFLFTQSLPESDQNAFAELQERFLRRNLRRGYAPSSANEMTEERAHNELLFHALILAPHQIEIIFVICTLLSGRRKIFVQNWLLQLGVDEVLIKLFDRMSWDAPPFSGPNAMEHIHGPTCECNPENAVRVQVLRLIHNYYDRDFMGNANKFALLSPEEQEFFLRVPDARADAGEGLRSGLLTLTRKGLLSRIIDILDKQESDSQYRFWLSACIENFLRGCGRRGQVFVTERGLLLSTVKNIFNAASDKNEDSKKDTEIISHNSINTYQTSFDLVGEIIKCNPCVLELLEAELSDEEFRAWIRVCLDHLVDSNVFLRSLVLTVEMYHLSAVHPDGACNFEKFGFVENALTSKSNNLERNNACFGYLTASWSQETPPICSSALQQYRDKKDLLERRSRAARAAKSTSAGGLKVKTGSNTLSSMVNNGTIAGGRASTLSTPASTHNNILENQRNSSNLSTSPAQQILHNLVSGFVSTITGGVLSSSSTTPASKQQDPKAIWEESEVLVVPNDATSSRMGDVTVIKEGAFYTPPEGPHLTQSTKSPNLSEEELTQANLADSHNGQDAGELSLDPLSIAIQNIKQQQGKIGEKNNKFNEKPIFSKEPAQSLTIQPKIFRFTMFVVQEKVSILLRLMSTVSVYSINHENICCLNSSLLMMLFDLQRHQLGQTLEKIRRLADDFNPVIPALIAKRKAQRRKKSSSVVPLLCVHLLTNDPAISTGSSATTSTPVTPNPSSIPMSESSTTYASNVGISGCGGCFVPGCAAYSGNLENGNADNNNSGSATRSSGGKKGAEDSPAKKMLKQVAEEQAIKAYQEVARRIDPSREQMERFEETDVHDESLLSNGSLVMMNFRELLWYWREYYLRRGRDRLSIEFSSHISFKHFLDLVDLLCADDGSETALLSASIPLPQSPYELSNLECLLESRSIVRAPIIHL